MEKEKENIVNVSLLLSNLKKWGNRGLRHCTRMMFLL